jgi:hypothetical protein
VGGVAQLLQLGLRGRLRRVLGGRLVDDEHAVARDPRHLEHARAHVGEVVRADAAGDDVEVRVREGKVLGAADDVRAHARRRVAAHDLETRLPQPARHVASAGGDIEGGARAGGPLYDEVEVRSLPVRLARAVGLGPV